ncbi:compound eye opsin BCRH2-like [Artemia franciscana]|uniref:compound eye opsin BCRH2-like n=1 Tax=Artemia franciscana TaxID=6661 RepID=UPI0032DB83DB
MNFSEPIAMAQSQGYDPWSLPESFTLANYVPEDVRSFLLPHWHSFKALHPMWYYVMGLYYLIMGSIALFGNIMVLKIFGKYPALRTPSNVYVMNLAFSDFTLMITLLPECIWNFFLGGPWRFGEYGCYVHAFCGALCGYNQIFTLVLLSLDRYTVIVKGFSAAPLTFNKAISMVALSWMWALAWSITPLFGWGAYAMDGILGTCSYDYVTRDFMNRSHITTACIFNWVMPLLTIMFCYWFIVQAVFKHEEELRAQAKKMNVQSLRSNQDQNAQSAEIRIAKVAIMNVSLWLVSWTPFAAISMMGIWGNPAMLTPLVSGLPVLLAKTSCAYNPLIYMLSHPKYRECLKESLPWICISETKSTLEDDNMSAKTQKTENSVSA